MKRKIGAASLKSIRGKQLEITSETVAKALIPKLAHELGREVVRNHQARQQIRRILRAQKTIKLINEA